MFLLAMLIPMPKKTAKVKEDAAPESKELQVQTARVKAKVYLNDERILSECSDVARELYAQSRFGTMMPEGKVQFSLLEAIYLLEKGKVDLFRGTRKLTFDQVYAKAKRQDKKFWVRYAVFKDLRTRGYIVKTALKFGADFRVYDRGIKPGEDHARWIVYPVHEANSMTWYDFSAKNRVAHSTKKRLLVGAVDDEGDVTYWEIKWMRP
jgi:tRNA-intron endonuclease, archaea type